MEWWAGAGFGDSCWLRRGASQCRFARGGRRSVQLVDREIAISSRKFITRSSQWGKVDDRCGSHVSDYTTGAAGRRDRTLVPQKGMLAILARSSAMGAPFESQSKTMSGSTCRGILAYWLKKKGSRSGRPFFDSSHARERQIGLHDHQRRQQSRLPKAHLLQFWLPIRAHLGLRIKLTKRRPHLLLPQ